MTADRPRPRRRRPLRSAALSGVLASCLVALGASTAAAVPKGTRVEEPVKDKCIGRSVADGNAGEPTVSWWGGSASSSISIYRDTRPTGRMYSCFYKFRIKDASKTADYWGLSVETVWSFTGGNRSYPAKAMQNVFSNRAAIDGIFGHTPTYVSHSACSRTIDVGVSKGPVSVSTPIQLCSDYTVRKQTSTTKGGLWTTDKAGGVRRMETVFFEKVPQGVVPTFTSTVYIPRYFEHFDGSHYSGIPNWITHDFKG